MKRFFSYTGDYGAFATFFKEEEARADIKASFDAVMDGGPQYLRDEIGDWCWGELRGVIRSGGVVPLDAPPHPEVESLRAELAALRERVGAVVATLQEMEANHRQGVHSPAHGGYSFERAEAYEHAADLLEEALEASTQAE